MRLILLALAAGFAVPAAAAPPAASANLLANAGFEKAPLVPMFTEPSLPGGHVQPFPGAPVSSQFIPDWTLAAPNVADLYRTPVVYGLAPAAAFEGQQYLLLNWSPLGGITLDNTISQNFVLGAGATGIDFGITMSVEAGFVGSTLQATIRDGNGVVAQSPLFNHTAGNRVWSQKSWSAALGPGAYTLALRGIGAGNAWDVQIDDVVLTQVGGAVGGVPEPASWAMLIAGFGLTGAAMRRKRAILA
jgi:hypothetical protein